MANKMLREIAEPNVGGEMSIQTKLSLVSTRVAARAVGLSTFFLYRRAHLLPAVYRAGRVLRWDVDALRKWMRDEALAAQRQAKRSRDVAEKAC